MQDPRLLPEPPVPLTREEITMMRRWEDNDFPDDQERLSHAETVALLDGWAKQDRASR